MSSLITVFCRSLIIFTNSLISTIILCIILYYTTSIFMFAFILTLYFIAFYFYIRKLKI